MNTLRTLTHGRAHAEDIVSHEACAGVPSKQRHAHVNIHTPVHSQSHSRILCLCVHNSEEPQYNSALLSR